MFRNIIRGIFVFLVGLCLVVWPEAASEILVKVLGILLILSGVITIVYGLATNTFQNLKGMSLITLASAVLFIIAGAVLLARTGFFIGLIGFVFGVILAMYGLLQIIHTYNIAKGIQGRFWLYLVPAIIFAVGIGMCFFPRENIKILCIIFGICLILLGAVELALVFKFRAVAKRMQQAAQEDADRIRENQNIVVEAIEPEEEPEAPAEEPFAEENPSVAEEDSDESNPDFEAGKE
ncbi:MAG: DUF308 domain-containing protein [Bacteroidales bacterium]|nr:DUF308 domain-containing protein [Bacteroidales bacterium]MBP5693369.1 DUF308 domain-containing protein [Bacteroidales bacterium]